MTSSNCIKISAEIINIDPQLVVQSGGDLWKQIYIGHSSRGVLADDLREQVWWSEFPEMFECGGGGVQKGGGLWGPPQGESFKWYCLEWHRLL